MGLIFRIGPTVQTRPLDDDYYGFDNHPKFQSLTIQLIQSLLSIPDTEEPLSSLLIETFSTILQIDPMIVNTTSAMEIAFHFLITFPENPKTRFCLLDTLEGFVLKKLWSEALDEDLEGDDSSGGVTKLMMRENRMRWLGKAVEMIRMAAERGKDDPFVSVSMSVLAAFLTWWFGPLPDGLVGAVFPSLAGILLQADDVLVIEVKCPETSSDRRLDREY